MMFSARCWRAATISCPTRSVGVGGALQVVVGAGAGGDDALRRDDARDAALVVGEEFVAVGGGQAVGFVVDEDERLGFFV